MDEIPSFGAWLRRRRKALDLTQAAPAHRVGYSVSAIRKLEADEYRPSREIAEHLADALGVAAEERAAFVHFARVGLDAEGTSVRLPVAAPPTPAAPPRAPAEGAAQPVPEGTARALPTGTVTFLFTDIEGSTRLWEQQPQAMPTALARHDAILRAAIAERAGVAFRTEGDAVCAAFARALHAEPWGSTGPIRVRLALEAAAARRPDFPDGVYVVALAAISSGSLLVSTIADALAFPLYGGADPEAQLLSFLRERHMLLVLDNFEHLLEGTRLLAQILDYAPGVKLLVTSRERLNLLEEWLIPLEGLHFPSDDGATDAVASYSAVQLFVQRAAQVQPGFGLSTAVQPAVLRICWLLDGQPLGIELAAAWARLLPCAEIAAEIAKNLDFLATSVRNLPARQRSLRAAFEHSWALLAEDERQVFARLAVFRGGFRREAAEAVAGASLALLSALVDKSRLHTHQSGRYEVHETLRQYAAERLEAMAGESDQAHDRHCGYYLALLQHTSQDELVRRLKDVLPKIDEDLENVRAAWSWAVAHDKLEEIGRSIHGIHHYHEHRSLFREGLDVYEHAVERLSGASESAAPGAGRATQRAAVIGCLLTREGWFYLHRGLFDQARDRAQESAGWLRSTNDRPEIARNLLLQGFIAAMFGPHEQAKQPLWECIAMTKETGQRIVRATALQGLGVACMALEDYAEARQHLQESLALFQALGHQWGIAQCLQHLGDVARAQEQYAEAQQRYQESLTVRTDLGDRWGMAIALGRLGSLARTIGAHEDAQLRYHESLAIFTALSHRLGIAMVLGNLGRVAFAQGKLAEAHQLHQESLSLSRATGNKRAIAISLNQLGMVHHALGDYRAARQAFDEALTTALEIGMVPLALEVLVGLAALVAQAGAAERAIELLALGLQHPAGTQRTRDRTGRLLAELAAQLPPEIVAAAQERGRQRDLCATRQELLAELEAAGWGAAHGAALTPPAP
jgi:predicted ATPase/transcriptional regulator with XRE-family HTH domain